MSRGIAYWQENGIIMEEIAQAVLALTRLLDGEGRSTMKGAQLAALDPLDRRDALHALTKARLLLAPDQGGPHCIRSFRAGDANWIAARQATLYEVSHGWGRALEALEAETVATFLRRFNPDREQCWVAEIEGVFAGAVFLTDEGGGTARLRLLHVEPFARRHGIGHALVRTCSAFACDKGYAELTLWTHAVLEGARRLYARNGFVRVASETHHAFGEPVLGETWRLPLREATS